MVRSRPGVLGDRFGQVREVLYPDATDVTHHLRGVAGVVPFEDLEYGLRMLQGLVAAHTGVFEGRSCAPVGVSRRPVGRALAVFMSAAGVLDLAAVLLGVGPRRLVILTGLGVHPGEQSAEILGVPEVVVDQGGGVGVGDHVLLEPQVVGEHVVDECTEQDDVRTRTDRDVLIAHRRRAGEAWVDVNHPGAAGLGLLHPLEPNWVALGHVGALDDDAVRVGHVL